MLWVVDGLRRKLDEANFVEVFNESLAVDPHSRNNWMYGIPATLEDRLKDVKQIILVCSIFLLVQFCLMKWLSWLFKAEEK